MPEQQLILACKQGKLWARKEVYEQYAPSMMALCRRYVSDTEDAKDVLQEGFIKVFTEIGKYSGSGSFGGWVRKIFVNTSLDYIRKKSRLNQKELRMDYEMEQTYGHSYDIEDVSTDDLMECISMLPADYTDIEHRPPVSFSLMTGFPLNDNLSIEAGLSYTYLYSRFNRNDRLVYRGSLQQHYMGVPVNLRYRVWHNDDWQVYLSGGGSIEKGLRSIYKQEIEQSGDRVFETSVYNRINGFQFSAQGGAGFSYRVQNNVQIFAEPRLIYYFNNNQPMSARTENPLVFGLNIGVRLQFQNK